MLKLEEYHGKYSIVEGKEKDGKFQPYYNIKSGYSKETGTSEPQKKDDGKWAHVPQKITLGEKDAAIKELLNMLSTLGYKSSDVPF